MSDRNSDWIWKYVGKTIRRNTLQQRQYDQNLLKMDFINDLLFHRGSRIHDSSGGDPDLQMHRPQNSWVEAVQVIRSPAEFNPHLVPKRAIAAARTGDAVNPESVLPGLSFILFEGQNNQNPACELKIKGIKYSLSNWKLLTEQGGTLFFGPRV